MYPLMDVRLLFKSCAIFARGRDRVGLAGIEGAGSVAVRGRVALIKALVIDRRRVSAEGGTMGNTSWAPARMASDSTVASAVRWNPMTALEQAVRRTRATVSCPVSSGRERFMRINET